MFVKPMFLRDISYWGTEQGSLASGLVASFRPDFEFVGFFAVLHRDDDLLTVTGFMQEVDIEAPQAL